MIPKDSLIPEPKERKAYPQQTPHSGRHFRPSHPAYRHSWKSPRRGRFTEGWYYRLTLPEEGVSFAIIISIEDPGHNPPSDLRLACIQVIGPHDEYLVQGDRDDRKFWAWKRQPGLGCTFAYKNQNDIRIEDKSFDLTHVTALSDSVWHNVVESGFQILPRRFLGKVRGRDGTKGSIVSDENNDDDDDFDPAEAFQCDFDFTVDPLCGWGGTQESQQKSTAGWLSSFPVFEPHWQIILADARATGSITWKNQKYQFTNAPFYAEKNWGAALPRKWYWTQCNSFDGYEQLSAVAGGGIRKVPLGKEEALGMVSVHYNGTLYEAVPWIGTMSWKVQTWGLWVLRATAKYVDRPFEVEVAYRCDPNVNPGLVFRAPTRDEGMVRFCRDTFEAETTLSLWELEWDEKSQQYVRKEGPPMIDRAVSSQGGAEIGGGPWWDEWKGESKLKKPIRMLLLLPYQIQRISRNIQKRRHSR